MRCAADADVFQIGRVEAGEHGDRDDLGVEARRRLCFFEHRAAARGVDREYRGFERPQRLDCLGDGVRNVVELEVEKNRQAELRHFMHTMMPVGAEEFETELEPADMTPHLLGQRQRRVEVRGVDGEIKR